MSAIRGPLEQARELAEQASRALSAGELATAESAAERALAIAPDLAPLVNLLGLVRLAQKRFGEAEAMFVRAAQADRRGAEYHVNRGIALNALGQGDQALECFRRAAQLAPADPQVLNNLGNALFSAGRFDDATAALRKAASLAPGWSAPHIKLGDALLKRGRIAEARAEYAQARAADPRSGEAMAALAFASYRLGDLDKAEELYLGALAAGHRDAAVLATLGEIAAARGDLDRAERCYREAIELDPAQHQPRVNLALLLLLTGRLKEGWREYRARPARASAFEAAGTLVESLTDLAPGAEMIVRGEQGLGDQLFFLRWLAALRRRGFRARLQLDLRLAGLLARSPDVRSEELVPPAPADHTSIVAAGDLPLLLDEAERHPPAPRLVADAAAAAAVATRLRALGPAPFVCVAWRAGTAPEDQGAVAAALSKQIPLEALADALRGAPATLVSVQRNPGTEETERLAALVGAPVHDLSDVNDDLELALALMATADEYVGVSSTNIHLRHAAGRRSRVLVPNPPEWRWGTRGPSPWFPDTHVYRADPASSWADAIARSGEELNAELSRRGTTAGS